MKTVKIQEYKIYADKAQNISINDTQTIINTINAHSFIVAKNDSLFREALEKSDILLPDGEGIVLMSKKLKGQKINKIAGADIHQRLLQIAQEKKLKCFYLGSSNKTLAAIEEKLSALYNNVQFGFYSPPFKKVFSNAENTLMIKKVNDFAPDILFVGMTAPKQEKWVMEHKEALNANVICSIGAVFDFIAETKKRAPQWVINMKLEWLYRSFTAWRLTKRYLYSTPLFLIELYRLKYNSKS
ncbi:MAG: WecB/TagA/CpsF family glycosyltransferase [Gelidibacter sp.]